MQAQEDVAFELEGSSRVSGTVYMAGGEHKALLSEAYKLFSITNPMHADVFPRWGVRKGSGERGGVVVVVVEMVGAWV